MGYVIRAAQLLTMPQDVAQLSQYGDGGEERDDAIVGLIEDGCVLVEDETIAWVGPWEERPKVARRGDVDVFETAVAMPGWIDCHTHAVFAGERSQEFAWRNAGKPYVEVLEEGGGILTTVEAVRRASAQELTDTLVRRAFLSVRQGVTTLEVKSGYGLTTADEIKSLKAVQRAQKEVPCELVGCFLGAHAVPAEYRDRREAYIDLVCEEMIPQVAKGGYAAYCDVFCDRGAFSAEEAERILRCGQEHGLAARIHADEITDAGAAMVAAKVGASSADHLEFVNQDGIEAMAKAGVVGVLMPAVNLFLGTIDHLAPARALLDAGCEVALATDFNPGSAMTQDLGTILMLGCTLYKLTPGEALRSITAGAAKALKRTDIGGLRAGARADVACFDVPHYRYLTYHFGQTHTEAVIYRGNFVYWTEEADVEE
ncbi:imidazolonepropionase [Lujinxingia vulgaris]|uniref:Imidazolonepropionase n=1 Tax=Lujinxingia vulgaris TaxID=2600176 RepID=A0A5C6X180_9DELT|nr:imidazolonepropionase [Lujinxingia vulgaris]TXD31990.1 imidazolonepropionase [Lujinxingia vulgaris]